MEKVKMVQLKDVCEFINGDRGVNYPKADELVDEGIPFINAGHIQNGSISFEDMNYITQEKYDKLSSGKVNKGDIVYCLRGSLGKHATITFDTGAVASSLVIMRPRTIILSDYLAYVLDSTSINTQMIKANNGSSQPNLSATSVKEFVVPLPSLKMQEKIISIMDKAKSLVTMRRQQIQGCDELIKSQFIEMFGDPVFNTMNWETKKVGDFCFVTKLAGFEYTKYIQYKDSGDVIMIRGLNVKNNKLKLDDVYYIDSSISDLLSRSQLKENDIVMTYVGVNIGDVALVDGNNRYHLAPNVAKISANSFNEINPLFFVNLMAFNKSNFASNATNTAKQALNMDKIRKLEVMFPPIELQNQFAQFVQQIDKLKFGMEQSLKELEDNFDSLMQRAFKGELF